MLVANPAGAAPSDAAEEKEEEYGREERNLEFMCRLYELQMTQGGLFLYEHAASALSWGTPCVTRLRGRPEVFTVETDVAEAEPQAPDGGTCATRATPTGHLSRQLAGGVREEESRTGPAWEGAAAHGGLPATKPLNRSDSVKDTENDRTAATRATSFDLKRRVRFMGNCPAILSEISRRGRTGRACGGGSYEEIMDAACRGLRGETQTLKPGPPGHVEAADDEDEDMMGAGLEDGARLPTIIGKEVQEVEQGVIEAAVMDQGAYLTDAPDLVNRVCETDKGDLVTKQMFDRSSRSTMINQEP